jgi:type I restriction enzyme S subunit
MSIGLKSFEECIEKITYGTKVQKSDYLQEGSFPIVSQEVEPINGYWNNKDDVFEIEKPVIIFGDHTRILKYVDFSFVLGADGTRIIKPRDFIDSKFFFYFLQANQIESKGYSRHYKFLKQLKIKVPPLPIQQKIVSSDLF